MPFFSELSVGNRILDSKHKELYELINGIVSLINARDVVALPAAFEILENSLCAYFAVEENIAQAVNFDFSQHRLAHQNLLNTVQRMKEELMPQDGQWPESEGHACIGFLRDCIIQHIADESKPLKIVLSTNSYDLKSS